MFHTSMKQNSAFFRYQAILKYFLISCIKGFCCKYEEIDQIGKIAEFMPGNTENCRVHNWKNLVPKGQNNTKS